MSDNYIKDLVFEIEENNENLAIVPQLMCSATE